jgi:hypothetical protein
MVTTKHEVLVYTSTPENNPAGDGEEHEPPQTRSIVSTINPASFWNMSPQGLAEYQVQLMLLEEQNNQGKRKLELDEARRLMKQKYDEPLSAAQQEALAKASKLLEEEEQRILEQEKGSNN